MKILNDKFYISQKEIDDLEKLLPMFDSEDTEQNKLANSIYLELRPKGFNFLRIDDSDQISALVQHNTKQIFYRKDWIICD